MGIEDKYRVRARELIRQAEASSSSVTRAKLQTLAAAFMRLAIQAERNAELVIDFQLDDQRKPG
jgi:hypothetical protein